MSSSPIPDSPPQPAVNVESFPPLPSHPDFVGPSAYAAKVLQAREEGREVVPDYKAPPFADEWGAAAANLLGHDPLEYPSLREDVVGRSRLRRRAAGSMAAFPFPERLDNISPDDEEAYFPILQYEINSAYVDLFTEKWNVPFHRLQDSVRYTIPIIMLKYLRGLYNPGEAAWRVMLKIIEHAVALGKDDYIQEHETVSSPQGNGNPSTARTATASTQSPHTGDPAAESKGKGKDEGVQCPTVVVGDHDDGSSNMDGVVPVAVNGDNQDRAAASGSGNATVGSISGHISMPSLTTTTREDGRKEHWVFRSPLAALEYAFDVMLRIIIRYPWSTEQGMIGHKSLADLIVAAKFVLDRVISDDEHAEEMCRQRRLRRLKDGKRSLIDEAREEAVAIERHWAEQLRCTFMQTLVDVVKRYWLFRLPPRPFELRQEATNLISFIGYLTTILPCPRASRQLGDYLKQSYLNG